MGAIKVHEFMAIDGVVENPSWTAPFGFDPKMGEDIAALTGDASAILLGRTTYEMFEPAWSTRTVDDDPGAPFFNDAHKHVVSSTLTTTTWANSSVLGPYDPGAIQKLKDSVDDTIYVSGSITLVRSMLADGLVDELHFFVYPVTVGEGLRMFSDRVAGLTLALADARTYDNGVIHLAYRP